jgi:hypothetical protein
MFVRRNTKNSTDVKDYTALKVVDIIKEFRDEKIVKEK